MKVEQFAYSELDCLVLCIIRCRNKTGPLLFAEDLLGVLESAFALAKWENLAFIVDEVKVFIDETNDGENHQSDPTLRVLDAHVSKSWSGGLTCLSGCEQT